MMTVVLGGGAGGLAAGYYLLRRFGQPATIFESSNRLGGWIRTERHKDKGFLFEAGPRTIRPKGVAGANTLELIEELQLPIEPILSTHAAARNRMIYAKGQLCMLPNSLGGVLKTIPPFSKPLASALLQDLCSESKKIKFGDESIYEFTRRRFGSEIADYAISPLICGICAGDAKEISVRFLMDDLFEKEQKWGGVIKGYVLGSFLGRRHKKGSIDLNTPGIFAEPKSALYERARREKWSIYSVNNGLETLPRSIGDYLRSKDTDIQLSSECREMTFTTDSVRLNIKGREVVAKHVISAIPSYRLAACVKDQHPGLAGQLQSIPYVDVAVVNLQYNVEDLLGTQAFGVLVPPLEQRPILGVIFDSCCFTMDGNTVLTVMMGGKWFEHFFGRNPSQKELLDTALKELERILGIQHEPRLTRVHILRKCIPQYTVGHKQRVEAIRRYIKCYKLPLSLCGAAYDGVGINDVILSARLRVEELATVQNET